MSLIKLCINSTLFTSNSKHLHYLKIKLIRIFHVLRLWDENIMSKICFSLTPMPHTHCIVFFWHTILNLVTLFLFVLYPFIYFSLHMITFASKLAGVQTSKSLISYVKLTSTLLQNYIPSVLGRILSNFVYTLSLTSSTLRL